MVSPIPKFHSVSLYGQPFLRYRPFWDKCTEWPPNWPWTLQGQSPCKCIASIPDTQISLRFAVRPAVFEFAIRTEWPQSDIEHYRVKGTHYKVKLYTYILLMFPSSKFHSVLLYDQPFSRYHTFYNSPLTTMLNVHNKCQKSTICNFTFVIQLW